MKLIFIFFSFLMVVSCADDVLVKPTAKLRLQYPNPSYHESQINCEYDFLINDFAELQPNRKNCGVKVYYPKMNATVYMTYQKVRSTNLDSLLYDAQKLAYNHDSRASGIPEQLFVNPENKTYGTFYSINGNAASQAHFYLTDSIQHFITGSLYFEAKPNFDSIYPAVMYLRDDMRKMMETMQWK